MDKPGAPIWHGQLIIWGVPTINKQGRVGWTNGVPKNLKNLRGPNLGAKPPVVLDVHPMGPQRPSVNRGPELRVFYPQKPKKNQPTRRSHSKPGKHHRAR